MIEKIDFGNIHENLLAIISRRIRLLIEQAGDENVRKQSYMSMR